MCKGYRLAIVLIGIFGLPASGGPLGARSVQEPVITPRDDGSGYSLTIWSPNRQFRQVVLRDCVLGVADASGNPIDVNASGIIRRITSDEPATSSSSDIVILGPSVASLLAARDASADGRVYSISYDVFDQAGHSAEGLCRIQVPRNPRLPAIDSGAHECVGPGC